MDKLTPIDIEATKDRAAQDHELAGGIIAPSLRPEADDGQWSQQPANDDENDLYEVVTQPMGYLHTDDLMRAWQSRQAEQAERGGG
jgi:hypothetical protein